jgi:HEAT repeat protein
MATSLEDRPGRQVTETLLDAVISVEAPHDVRLTAAWSLRDRPDRAITDALLATLHDCTDPQTRWYLLRALATRPGQDVTDALLHALTSGEEDSHARRVQALELRDRPEPKVTAALREALKDPDMTVRRSAAGALTDRLEPSITDALLEALDDDESPTSGNPPSRRYPFARIRASPPNSSTH